VFAMAALLPSPACFADAVLDWNEVALARVVASGQPPPDGARTMAMVHVAIFDAVNAIEQRYKPYAFSGAAPAHASADAAAAGAARTVLNGLFPLQVQQIDAAYKVALARAPSGSSRNAGIALGEQVGRDCLAMRTNDGAGLPSEYRPRTTPGSYVPTV